MNPFTVLIVDDERTLAHSIRLFLSEQGYRAEVAEDGEAALALVERLHPDLVFLDVRLPKVDGLTLLKRIRRFDPTTYVVVMTAYGTIEGAVEAMRHGAFDYLKKPVDLNELLILLQRAEEDARLRKELAYYRSREKASGLEGLIGRSEAIQRVRAQVEQLSLLDDPPPVLITGETGTGKGLVARTLHYRSRRARGPFIEVECTALPPTLFEAELFGYERGAFTDAKESKVGLLEAADGGTLFLDEIGDLDLALQGKLLKVIEERTVRRIGSVRGREIDAWFIAATNKDLGSECARGNFRKDLYFRIAVVTIHLPPLRERPEDILPLADHFLERFRLKYRKPQVRGFSERAVRVLMQHPWPGNVRELMHVVERAVLWCTDAWIEPDHLGLSPGDGRPEAPDLNRPDAGLPGDLWSLPELERRMIERALAYTRGNFSRAARLLQVSRDTLRYRVKKFKIPVHQFRSPKPDRPPSEG